MLPVEPGYIMDNSYFWRKHNMLEGILKYIGTMESEIELYSVP